MSKFAKIIELKDDEQVLLTIDYNNDEDNYDVKVRTDFKGLSMSMSLGFDEEEKAIKMLNTFTEKNAIDFRKKMIETFK